MVRVVIDSIWSQGLASLDLEAHAQLLWGLAVSRDFIL